MTGAPEPTIVDATVEGTLGEALSQVPGLVGIVLADTDGLPLISTFPEERGVPEATAMGAVAADIGRRMARHLEVGESRTVTFGFSSRYLYVSSLAERRALLLAVAKKNVNLGLMYLALEDLKEILEGFLADYLRVAP